MDPILKIVCFFFKKNKIDIKIDSIQSFFENGVLFPKFVALSIKIDEIPNIKFHPRQKEEKQKNNEIALQYLFSNSPSIAKENLSISTKEGQYLLLKQILTKVSFSINEKEILDKFNSIVNDTGNRFSEINEIINWKSLILLLNSLSNEKIHSKSYDFDGIVTKSFNQLRIPLVVDKNSIKEENRFQFLIQIEILFEIYSQKVREKTATNKTAHFNISTKLTFDNYSPTISKSDSESYKTESESDSDYSRDSTDTENEVLTEEQKRKNLLPKNYNDLMSDSDTTDDQQESNETDNWLNDEKFNEILIDTNYESSDEDENETKMEDLLVKEIYFDNKQQKKKKRINKLFLFQEMREQILLNTINAILQESAFIELQMKMNVQLDEINQLIENDMIPKFVMMFLNLEKIENVDLNHKDKHQKNICAVIDYLKKIESKFEVLNFDFSNENKYITESSTILFYNTFLNYFFLSSSKNQMIKRCKHILFPAIDPSAIDSKKLLTNWQTYLDLVNFLMFVEKRKEKKKNEVTIFEEAGIPLIFEKDFPLYCSSQKEIPFELFYQLQFIFNALDKKFSRAKVAEKFLIATSKLKQIKVPRIDIITASIRAKNISLILQSRSHKQFLNNPKKKDKTNIKIDDIKNENEEDKKRRKEEKKRRREEIRKKKEEEEIERNLLKFSERLIVHSNQYLKKEKKINLKLVNIKTPDEYWNTPDHNYVFEDGVLINKNLSSSESEFEWSNSISTILQKVKKSDTKQLLNETKTQSHIYKFFIYDEKEQKWRMNYNDYSKFNEYIESNSSTVKTPLILFLNSSEKDLIKINSKITSVAHFPPSDEICVYGVIDTKFKSKSKTNIKPILLNLHVPKNKENKSNIQRITVTIYSFLSIISDVEIVILNEKVYKSQIELIEFTNKLIQSFPQKAIKKPSLQKQLSPNKKEKNDEIIDEIIDDSISSDDDYEDYDDDRLIIPNIKPNKARRTIFLINEENRSFSAESDDFLRKTNFFRDLLKFDENKAIHFINVNEMNTYHSFINDLNDFITKSQSSLFEIKEKMEFVEMMNSMSNVYISLRMKEDWKDELESLINNRYSMLEIDERFVVSYLNVVSKLQKEITVISPPFDSEFESQIKNIISNLKKKINEKNHQFLIKELERSSNVNLCILNRFKDYELLSSEKVENIINGHIYFLKEEFFNIIEYLCQPNNYNIVYEDNIDVLNQQIQKDIEKIKNEVVKKTENCKSEAVVVDSDVNLGTNYSIREAVNVREMKAQIEFGQDLKTIIDQDF